jgi:hypothetical protein
MTPFRGSTLFGVFTPTLSFPVFPAAAARTVSALLYRHIKLRSSAGTYYFIKYSRREEKAQDETVQSEFLL